MTVLMLTSRRMTEAERGFHQEGDTPDNSEVSEDDDVEEDESLSCDDIIEEILGRADNGGRLEYLVRPAHGEASWEDRSDLWDFGAVSKLIDQYDKGHPVEWDTECAFCGDVFDRRQMGCEECRCPDCEAPCRHLQACNYGCVRHPVI